MKMRALVLFGLLALAPAAFAQGVNDAQIAAIVVTANQVDIDAGKLAESMGSSPEVKKFGKDMVRDHTGVNKSAVDLVTRLKVTPEDNPTALSLNKGGMANVENLKTMKGKAFVSHLAHAKMLQTKMMSSMN
jgi:putative membrane protein